MFSFVAAAFVAALSIFSGGQATPSGLVARQTYQSRGTWFYAGLGACGHFNRDYDLIVAVSASLYDSDFDYICNKIITATNPATGASVTVTVVERCEGCQIYDLNFSIAAFTKLGGDFDVGVINIDWHFD